MKTAHDVGLPRQKREADLPDGGMSQTDRHVGPIIGAAERPFGTSSCFRLMAASGDEPPIIRLCSQSAGSVPFAVVSSAPDCFVYRAAQVPWNSQAEILRRHKREIGGQEAVLILDMSYEGPGFTEAHIAGLREEIDGDAIAGVVVLTQNKAYVEKVERLGEERIRPVYFHLFLESVRRGATPILGNAHNLRNFLRDRFPFTSRKFPAKFTCLLNRARPHRLVLFGWLKENGLLDEGCVSFHGAELFADEARLERSIADAKRLYPSFASAIDTFVEARGLIPYQNFESSPGENFLTSINIAANQSSPMSLVGESEMTQGGIWRFTEKSLKPLVAGHRFLIAGNPHTYSLLREMGFSSPGFDFKYDWIQNQDERLLEVLARFSDYMNMTEAERRNFLIDSWMDCQENITTFNDKAAAVTERSWSDLAEAIGSLRPKRQGRGMAAGAEAEGEA